MLHYDFGLICESVIIDQQTNHLSIIKVIEGFNFKKFPSNLSKIYIVTSWSKTESFDKEQKETVRLRLAPSEETEVKSPEATFEVVVPADKKKLRAIIEIGGLPIEKDGEHKIAVETKQGSDWAKAGYITFDVTSNPTPDEMIGLPKG